MLIIMPNMMYHRSRYSAPVSFAILALIIISAQNHIALLEPALACIKIFCHYYRLLCMAKKLCIANRCERDQLCTKMNKEVKLLGKPFYANNISCIFELLGPILFDFKSVKFRN